MQCVTTTKSAAAAASRIGARLGARKRRELLCLLRPCFTRTEPWLQAGKYVNALVSGLPKCNGWTIAERAGDRTPDWTQRLLNRAAWDTFAAMGVVRQFAVAGLEEAARRSGWRRGLGRLPQALRLRITHRLSGYLPAYSSASMTIARSGQMCCHH